MWMTWPPAASIRAAAAMTSMTMNGGTSLRREGSSHCPNRFLNVASFIDFCYSLADWSVRSGNGRLRPRLAALYGS
ncbi:hypothetical protein ACVW04_004890 [Bradyrhizobium sp. LM2.3]